MNADGSTDLERLNLGGIFGYPKPVELLRILIESQTWDDPDALVLDFFAGSGTTAEAVLRSNLRDGGRRRFLLAQLPEPLRTEYSSTGGRSLPASADAEDTTAEAAPDFPTIAAFCSERVRRAIAAHSDSGGEDVDFTVLTEEQLVKVLRAAQSERPA